jgi:beta-glucosidase
MPDPSTAPYRDPRIDPAKRVEDLLGRMSLDEKLAQLGCVWSTALVEDEAFSPARAAELLRHGIGHITRIGAATGLRPRESAAFANRIQRHLLEETRLGVPAIVHEESTAGFTARDATQFPQAIGLASTWDPDLVERAARVIRAQMRAVGARQTLAPVLDVGRDPRWGRTEETYGEDPYLAARIGVAYVRGIQGDDLREGVAATGKHFLAYSVSEGGRNHKPAHVGPRELREVYARPFAAAIAEAGLASIMNAYNEVDGLPCGGSKAILDDLLRGELDFDGVVVADYFTTLLLIAVHRVAGDKAAAARIALEAGLDVELPALDCYGAPLRQAVEAGDVPLASVDRSVRRALRLKFELGLFEAPTVDEAKAAAVYQTPEQRQLSREVAARSIVLLKNEGALLPLAADTRRIAVLGPCADDIRLLQGDYSYPAHTEILFASRDLDASDLLPRSDDAPAFAPGPYYVPMVSPLAGIREAVGAGCEVHWARGCDVLGDDAGGIEEAVACAAAADVAIVCVGGRSGLLGHCTSGEFRDAASLALTGLQQRLVEAVVATGTPSVVVLVNGRVLSLPWIAEHVPAVVEAWLPGEEGGRALARVLFGTENPSGRLPVTMPREVGQVPLHAGRKWRGGSMPGSEPRYADLEDTPLFPFGHGLSYTRFDYGALDVRPERAAPDGEIELALDVSNTGERVGVEVVQLYVHDRIASTTRPVQQLVGFTRVPLAPGQCRRVRFRLDPSQLALYDPHLRLVVEPGEFEARVGASSEDIRARQAFRIEGEPRPIREPEIVSTRVEIGEIRATDDRTPTG